MHIGLIGGIGPGATDYYYRRLIANRAAHRVLLELTIAHADTPTLYANLAANDAAAQVAIYVRLTNRVAAAGADRIAITSIAGHFCVEAFKPVSALPVIDIILEVDRAIARRGYNRIGILGTRTAMATRFFGGLTTATLIPPDGQDLDDVHEAYVAMSAAGAVTDTQRETFLRVGKKLIAQGGAEAIMLGGTDLALALDEANAPFPLIDCAGIHADAIAGSALV